MGHRHHHGRVAVDEGTFYGGEGAASILGPLFIEWWDSELGIALAGGAVDTWTGQHRGIVLQAAAVNQRLAYTTVDAAFGHRPSLSGDGVLSRLRALGLSGADVPAAGTRPYLACVIRYPVLIVDGLNHELVNLELAGAADRLTLSSHGTAVTSDLNIGELSYGGAVATTTVMGTNTHLVEGWVTSGNVITLAVDGVVVGTDPGGSTIGSVDSYAVFGSVGGGPNRACKFDMSYLALCTAAPSTTQRTALHAWSRVRWGTP
jgi:hypothetical protein